MGELQGVAVQYAEVLSRSFALTAFVADRDRILAAAGSGRRDLADRSVSQPLEKVMESRKPYLSEGDPSMSCCPARVRCGHCSVRGPSSRQGMSPGPWVCWPRTAPSSRPCPAEGCGCGGSVLAKQMEE